MDHSIIRRPGVALVDIAPFFADDPEARRRVVARVAAAMEDVGSLRLTGHGVSPAVVERMDRAWRAFFARSLADKRAYMPADPRFFRGYYPASALANSRELDVHRPPDLREVYLINRPDALPQAYLESLGEAADCVGRPNIWPDDDAELRAATEAYYRAMERLAGRLMQIFAVGLGLPRDYFADKIDRHYSSLSASHYPEQLAPPRPGQLRCGVHTDYGSMTILHLDDAPGGLQIQRPDGGWIDVPSVPGTLIVNLGDTMREWTGGRWKSPPHRVVNPPPELAGRSRRQSLQFFHAPNYDAPIAPIPGCARGGDPPGARPRTVGELIFENCVRATQTAAV